MRQELGVGPPAVPNPECLTTTHRTASLVHTVHHLHVPVAGAERAEESAAEVSGALAPRPVHVRLQRGGGGVRLAALRALHVNLHAGGGDCRLVLSAGAWTDRRRERLVGVKALTIITTVFSDGGQLGTSSHADMPSV